jgi:hypothetical protein
MGEAEIDRDPARFFFGQPIGVDTSKCFDKRGLPVIDMAGGREDDVSWRLLAFARRASSAAAIGASSCGKTVRRSS